MNEHPTGAGSVPRVPTLEDFPESGINALATFPQRAWARVLDTFLVMALVSVFLPLVPVQLDDPEEASLALIWFLGLWVVLAGAYDTIAVARWGVTVGKLALGTRVARFVDGERPTWEQAGMRILLPLAGATALGVVGLPIVGAGTVYMSSLSNPFGRGWHDRAGGTIVIRTR